MALALGLFLSAVIIVIVLRLVVGFDADSVADAIRKLVA